MATHFDIMTWNLENLFPAGHESGPKSLETYERKMINLVATVERIAPHVIAVQEVGDPPTFADLQRRFHGRYPHAALSRFPDGRGIRVGFLSQLPFVDQENLSAFPDSSLTQLADAQGRQIDRFGRGVLRVAVEAGKGLRIDLVTAHLKSKLITYPGEGSRPRRSPRDENERARETAVALLKRCAEAVALRVYANRITGDNPRPVIVLGDFNDAAEAITSRLLLGTEDGSLARPDKGDDTRLYNLADYIPIDHRYSRIYRKQRELIDHILVSYELIFRRRLVDSHVDPLDSIDESVEKRRDETFPDHAPVYARFEFA